MSYVRGGIEPGSRWWSVDKDRVFKYGCTYKIETDTKDDWAAVASAPCLPPLYSSHPGNSAALCTGGKASEDGDSGKVWKVAVEWSTDAIEKKENPLEEPVRYSLQWSQHEKVVEKDIEGNAIANTLGDLFRDPPYTQDDSRPTLVAKKNFPASQFDQLVAMACTYKDAVSTDAYKGTDPGVAKMTNIQTGELQTLNEIEYYQVTFEIQFDPEGWQPELLNRGHRAKDSSGNIYELPNKEVRNLKEDGTLVGPDDDPYYVPFNTFNEQNISALEI